MKIATQRIAELMNQFTPEGDFTISEVRDKVRAHLEEYEPDTLDEFLTEQLDSFLSHHLRGVMNARRMKERRRAKARAFSDKVQNWQDNPEDEVVFETTYVIDDDGTRRRVGSMTGNDHKFVATNYENQAARAKNLASFHRAVAKAVGNRKTEEVLTERQYLELMAKVIGKAS